MENTKNKFLLKDAIRYGIDSLISHPGYFIKLFLYILALFVIGLLFFWSIFFAGIFQFFIMPPTIISLILAIMGVIIAISSYATMIMFCWQLAIKALLRFHDQGPYTITMRGLLSYLSMKELLTLTGAAFCLVILLNIGFICLVIPGLYFLVKSQFVFLNIVDTNCGVFQAFRRSFAQTKNHFWELALLEILAWACKITIILWPAGSLMKIYAYRRVQD